MAPEYYEIRVQGHLERSWSDWFGGLSIRDEEGGECVLSGRLRDQAALHGLLERVRDLNLRLISVKLLEGPRPIEDDGKADV